MNKVYYDGDASKIISERLILELIQENKIVVRDNKILFHIMFNKGTTREPMPVYTLGRCIYTDMFYKKAFEGSWIYRDEKGGLRIDYDLEVLDRMIYLDTGKHILGLNEVNMPILDKGDVENDNGTLKESICESNNGES